MALHAPSKNREVLQPIPAAPRESQGTLYKDFKDLPYTYLPIDLIIEPATNSSRCVILGPLYHRVDNSQLMPWVVASSTDFKPGTYMTVDLCPKQYTTGSPTFSKRYFKKIRPSVCQTLAVHTCFDFRQVAEFFLNLQLWQLVILMPVDLQRPTVPFLKDLNLLNKHNFNKKD